MEMHKTCEPARGANPEAGSNHPNRCTGRNGCSQDTYSEGAFAPVLRASTAANLGGCA
jgi:hypothetical protein